MEKCKFCQEELAENSTVCPSCGKDNAEAEFAAEAIVKEETTVEETTVEETTVEETTVEETVAEETKAEETAEAAAQETQSEQPAEPVQEETPAEVKKATPGKIALAVAAVVLLLAVLIALITMGAKNKAPAATEPTAAVAETQAATIPADGNPDDVTCKGTYTVADDVAIAEKDTVVATMGDAVLTNARLRIYYRSALSSFLSTEYGYYMMMYGMLDTSRPLDTQLSHEGNTTWQQFFVQYALENWQMTQALALEAEANGVEMDPEDKTSLDTMRDSLEELAANHSLTVEDMLASDFGPGVSYEDFEDYQALYLQGSPYYDAEVEKFEATDEELEAYFKEHEESYASSGVTMDSKVVDVRHILVQVKGGTADESGNTVYSDEEWAACEAEAQAILDQWLAGDKTEDSFAALANEKSEDPGSNTNGGLYENVYQGQMVEPFENWCFDETRQYADSGLVRTSYGYHVMFYVGSEPLWKQYAQDGWKNEQISKMLEGILENYPMEVTYENISLGELKMA